MLSKALRVKKKQDFQKIFTTGNSLRANNIVCRYLPNQLNRHRASFTISKKLKLNAVGRNRIRRQASESFKEAISTYQSTSSKFDFIFIVSRLPKEDEKRYNRFRNDIEKILSKINFGATI